MNFFSALQKAQALVNPINRNLSDKRAIGTVIKYLDAIEDYDILESEHYESRSVYPHLERHYVVCAETDGLKFWFEPQTVEAAASKFPCSKQSFLLRKAIFTTKGFLVKYDYWTRYSYYSCNTNTLPRGTEVVGLITTDGKLHTN